MEAIQMTYANLFTLLKDLGFCEQAGDGSSRSARVFVHDKTDTIMLYRKSATGFVSPADLLSTEVRLHAKNIADQTLETLYEQMMVRQ